MEQTEKALGKYKGWDIKIVRNEKTGIIVYMAYFDQSPTRGLICITNEHLEGLKAKIDKIKLRKGAGYGKQKI